MRTRFYSIMAWGLVAAVTAVGADAPGKEAAGGEGRWYTDFEEAKGASVKANVPIIVNFSGSDWCYWCKKLDKEVFSTKAFREYAAKRAVLFLADFPQDKKVPDALRAQNEALLKTYGVQGFPTVLLLDSKGKVLAKTGYRKGGAEAYVKHLEELVAAHWKGGAPASRSLPGGGS